MILSRYTAREKERSLTSADAQKKTASLSRRKSISIEPDNSVGQAVDSADKALSFFIRDTDQSEYRTITEIVRPFPVKFSTALPHFINVPVCLLVAVQSRKNNCNAEHNKHFMLHIRFFSLICNFIKVKGVEAELRCPDLMGIAALHNIQLN